MRRWVLVVAAVVVLMTAGGVGADAYCRDMYNYTAHGYGTFSASELWQGQALCYTIYPSNPDSTVYVYYSGTVTFMNGTCSQITADCFTGGGGALTAYSTGETLSGTATLIRHSSVSRTFRGKNYYTYSCGHYSKQSWSITVSPAVIDEYIVSGNVACTDVELYQMDKYGTYTQIGYSDASTYNFDILNGSDYMLLFTNGAYYFTCTGNEVFDNDACLFVYGYTCGIDSIKLYVDDGGSWVLNDTEAQGGWYKDYEMLIVSGEDYLISFLDGGTVCHNQTFTCTGDHVLIDYDRCEWVYPPSPWEDPIIIYLWAGYAYNIVVFRDEHGNFIENSQLAIYDKTDGKYLQRWTDTKDGYTLLGARFDTDHDVLLTLRTFDGVFTLDTEYPANGSALVGEENITTTNWTIPIRYNLRVFPMDQAAVPLFDVFCGLSEYTPLNPQAFWGMDLGNRGYVAVDGCSGFSMCDLLAEKAGYRSYNVTALNWSSKSALVKDYRHTAVLEEET